MNRILLIEDDSSAQLLYGNRLTDLGYQVVIAATGALGLMEARSAPFDLFLIDIHLGKGIDGYEVCRRLKTTPEIHGVPVVLISGNVKTQADLHRGYEAGCQSFLVKGDPMLLEDVVRAMLRIKSLQDELTVQNRLLGRGEAEKARGAEQESAPASGPGSRTFACPEALLLVDGEGVVATSDRGARDLFGQAIEGKHLAVLAPHSRLEATVRNARTEPTHGVRFEVPERAGRASRAMVASVHSFVPHPDPAHPNPRLVQVFSATRRPGVDSVRGEEGILAPEWQPLLESAREVFRPSAMLGGSAAMRELRARARQFAQAEGPVLVRGPSGSGKAFVARVLHFSGPCAGPFVSVVCGGPGASEEELFGAAKSPSTGEARPGATHRANGGTLFLQDVERLAPDLQRRLLQVLTTGRLTRQGATTAERVDLRLIASSRTPAAHATGASPFLAELETRFAGATLTLPALRDRPGDIPVLARHFLERSALHEDAYFAPAVLSAFERYSWPDNVRELEQAVHRAASNARSAEIGPGDVPPPLSELVRGQPGGEARSKKGLMNLEKELSSLHASLDSTVSLLDAYEKGALLHSLQLSGGDKLFAAKLLGIGKSTFYRKLKQHGIT